MVAKTPNAPSLRTFQVGTCTFRLVDGPFIAGVINLSPESPIKEAVVDGVEGALARAKRLIAGGASMVDLGGRSSLHSARFVTAEEEQQRLLPVIRALKEAGYLLSVDTWDAETARLALEAGVDAINDSGGMQDSKMIDVVAEAHCPVIVPFLNGPTPRDLTPLPVGNPMDAMIPFFEGVVARAERAGIGRLLLDPGTGYAQPHATWEEKEVYQDTIYPQLAQLRRFGFPLYIAPPWKPPEEMLPNLIRVLRETGADFLRAHNITVASEAVAAEQARRRQEPEGAQ